ncbi:CDF family Co(II)/Ni(II) efflux transporter DmeF [Tichowtungia aerotolerans]|uniref:CDF family Co(II)/Ni(II) efflux transporter DmeF n=1 Tax=Tichowtungia aerotolerans TaxID=2697043 RepID=A0A6P1MB01_9BACT|nr:CDF family Co(II)/Ni(II) efflux transporter DmeF [Tichowtungia aerotolerans]QHI68295.1 CDF family Co(II)/Ni(II) efflux transporter DmeF [Tichowtungia aerotolerans]
MNTDPFRHEHDYLTLHEQGRKRSWIVLVVTLVVMVIEIAAGTVFGSMALLADGWHMSTHAVAFIIVLAAYHYAEKHARDPAFSFGTGKFGVLGGFASAVALAVVALTMLMESLQRLIHPEEIRFNEALGVAALGLAVNAASVFILKTPHEHHHDHGHHHHEHDHNLKAAYMHVLADALTSVLAIVALLFGKYFGWNRLDAFVGIVGSAVIARWAYGLLCETAPILLDSSAEKSVRQEVLERIEKDGDARVADLHIWKVGPSAYAVIVSLVTREVRSPDCFKAKLKGIHHLDHITIEVNPYTNPGGGRSAEE